MTTPAQAPAQTADTSQDPANPQQAEAPAPDEGAVTAPGREASEEPAEGAAPASEGDREGAPSDADPDAGKPEGGHKRKGGWQRAIDRLERENEALRAALTGQPTRPTQPAEPTKAKTPEEAAAEFIDAQVEKRLAAREAQRQQQAAAEAFQARTQEVRAAHPDFDEVIASVDVPVSRAVQEALLTSGQGPRIMYQLASNPDELARISALPPLAAALEIGRLEVRLASSTAAPAKPSPSPAPRKPAAPAPITPVTSRGPTAIKSPDQMSYEEYSAWRESQRKR